MTKKTTEARYKMFVYVCVCAGRGGVCVCVFAYDFVRLFLCLYVCLFVYIWLFSFVCICIYVSVCLYEWLFIIMCNHIYAIDRNTNTVIRRKLHTQHILRLRETQARTPSKVCIMDL